MPRALLLAVLLAVPAALEAQVEIVKPAAGWPASDPAVEIRLPSGVDERSVEVTLNGTRVPATGWAARPVEGGATVTGRMAPELLVPATFNVLGVAAVDAGGASISAESHFLWFQVDSSQLPVGSAPLPAPANPDGILANLLELLPTLGIRGPELVLSAPAMGAFIGIGQPLAIAGSASDPAGVTAIFLALDGGEPVPVEGAWDPVSRRFHLETTFVEPGLHRVVVAATNPAGGRTVEKVSVHVGDARAPGTPIEEASRFLLTSHGLDQVGNLIEPTLTPDPLYRNIAKGQSVWKAKTGAIKADLKLLALGHSRLNLILGFEDGLLHAQAVIDGMEARTGLNAKYLFVKTRATPIVTASRVTWDAWAQCTKSPGQGVSLELERDQLTIEDLQGEIPGLPGALARAAMRLLRQRLHEAVRLALAERILPGLEQTLDKYFFVRSGPHPSNVLGSPVHVGGELTHVSVEGSVGTFRSKSTVLSDAPVLQPLQAGWLSTAPTPGLALTAVQDLTIAVDDDVLNAALFEAFRAGTFNLDLTELLKNSDSAVTTVGVLGDSMGNGLDLSRILGLANDLPISIEFQPMLSPVFIAGYRGSDLILQIHEIFLDLYLELEETRPMLFRLVVDIDLPLSDWVVDHQRRILTIHPETLSVGIDSALARIDFRVERMPILEFPFGPFVNLVTRIAYLALPFLLEILCDSSLSGLGDLPLDNVHVWGEHDHLLLSGDLLAPEAENGGESFVADGVDRSETKKKFGIETCALVALLGGSGWDGLLDVYRRFRDQVLGRLPGGQGATNAYYRVGPAVCAAFAASPPLRTAAFPLAVGLGLVLLVVLDPGFQVALALTLAALVVRRLARRLDRALPAAARDLGVVLARG